MRFIHSDLGRYRPDEGQQVIKADSYQSLCHANSLIEHAERESRKLKEKARKAYEQAEEAGYEAGLQQARDEMLEHYLHQSREATRQLGRLEQRLVDLVGECVRAILDEWADEEKVTSAARRLIQRAELSGPLRMRVNESALARVQDEIVKFEKEFESLVVVVDHHLETDAFVLESDAGIFYGSISEQLSTMLDGIAARFGTVPTSD